MKNISVVDRLSEKSEELNRIIEHMRENTGDSRIYMDMCLNKVREMYEILLFVELPVEETVVATEEQPVQEELPEKDNSSAQTEYDNELENLNFYQDSENNDYADIPITDESEPEEQVVEENLVEHQQEQEEVNEEIETYGSDAMIETESEPEPEPEIMAQTEFESSQESESEPTLFKTSASIEEKEQEMAAQELDHEADIDIKGLVNDIRSQKESIGEKYMGEGRKSLNDLLAEIKKEKDLATHMQYQRIDDLRSVITLNDKIRFIRELFDSSNGKYTSFIDAINNCNDLDEAMAIINENITWDDTKESFKDFLELVYRRHMPENN